MSSSVVVGLHNRLSDGSRDLRDWLETSHHKTGTVIRFGRCCEGWAIRRGVS
jgi:hypothetical protein